MQAIAGLALAGRASGFQPERRFNLDRPMRSIRPLPAVSDSDRVRFCGLIRAVVAWSLRSATAQFRRVGFT